MEDWLVVFPVLLPLSGAAIGMLLRKRYRSQVGLTITAILAALGCSLGLLATVVISRQPVVFQVGAWPAPAGITMIGDELSAFMVVMSQAVLAAGILYATGCKDKCVHYPAFYPLFLTLATGLTGALLTGDIFNLFVFTELMVISGAVLTSISDDRHGVEAAYKYFYISLLASMFLLLASGALYASYGTLNMADLARQIAARPDLPLSGLAMVFLLAFFMVKSAVVPFHFWQPDFHTAAPTPVHAVLSSVVVKLGVYGFIRMITLLYPHRAPEIQTLLVLLGCVGVILGGLGATGTYDAKRMLAYSTLGQIGFILVAIGWGTPLALSAALVYTFNHSLIKSAMLMMAGAMASRAPVKSAAFKILVGVGKASPSAGALFLLGGIALAGIPPTNGFISKLLLFQGGIAAQAYLPLAVVGIASLLTMVYIVRSFMKIWWETAPDSSIGGLAGGSDGKPKGDRLIIPTLLIGLCLAFGLWAEPLVRLTQSIVDWLGDPFLYIRAVLGG
jgi:multicomponent Na+:H+ antiporter subunit D